MTSKKLNIMVMFGGKSTEHNVSVISGLNTLLNMDPDKYNATTIYINREGHVSSFEEYKQCVEVMVDKYEKKILPHQISSSNKAKQILNGLCREENCLNGVDKKITLAKALSRDVDIVFPVFHGINGEDGSVQGLLEFLNIPYIGCGLSASAIGIDKELSKLICEANDIPILEFSSVHKADWLEHKESVITKIEEKHKFPIFVKPARLGSSIGIAKVESEKDLPSAIDNALKFDDKLVIEDEMPNPRELTISIMGDDEELIFSEIGEFNRTGVDYFDFSAKYGGESHEGYVPAIITPEIDEKIRLYSKQLFRKLQLSGYIRVDYFVKGNNVFFNEINTIPGMETNGTFGRIWDSKGVDFDRFLEKAIELGLKRHSQKKSLSYIFDKFN